MNKEKRLIMSEEEIKRIENTINENKDYREHFHLHDYFEVEYIDKLLTSYKQIQQENQELKQKYEMQKDSNKLLCKAITCDDCNCSVCEAHKENIELKKQFEEERNKVREYSYKLSNFRCEETYENQQKEFIDYLEKKIKRLEKSNNEFDRYEKLSLKEILSKYKEIIGDDKMLKEATSNEQ